MATVRQFEDLQVWQEARQLVDAIYSASKARPFDRDFNLWEQIRRAAHDARVKKTVPARLNLQPSTPNL